MCVCLCSNFSFFKDTRHTGLVVTSHFNLITSLMILFSNTVTFWGNYHWLLQHVNLGVMIQPITYSNVLLYSLQPIRWCMISICPITDDVSLEPWMKVVSPRPLRHSYFCPFVLNKNVWISSLTLYESLFLIKTSVWTHGFLFSSMGYNMLPSLIILVLKVSQIWPVGEPSRLASISFCHNPIILWAFL